MFLSGLVPAIVQLGLIFGIPESPRFSIRKNRLGDAQLALSRIYEGASANQIQQLVEKIQQAIEYDDGVMLKPTSFSAVKQALWVDLPTRRALVLACGLQFYQQFTGKHVSFTFGNFKELTMSCPRKRL